MGKISRLHRKSGGSNQIDPDKEQRKLIWTSAIIIVMQMIIVVTGWIYFERVMEKLAQIVGLVK